MSWSFNIVGTRDNVVAAVARDPNLPQVLKDVVAVFANAGQNTPKIQPECIQVRSGGHYDPARAWSSVSSFSVEPVEMAPPVEVGKAVESDSRPPAAPGK